MRPSTGAAVRLHRNAVRDRPDSLSAFKWNACPPSPESAAGIDHERVHLSSRPSRRRTSDGVCFRRLVSFRRSPANFSKEGSTSLTRARRRISRCSASVERPCRAARRFKRAISSSPKLRTCRFPGIRLVREIIDLNDLKRRQVCQSPTKRRGIAGPASATIDVDPTTITCTTCVPLLHWRFFRRLFVENENFRITN